MVRLRGGKFSTSVVNGGLKCLNTTSISRGWSIVSRALSFSVPENPNENENDDRGTQLSSMSPEENLSPTDTTEANDLQNNHNIEASDQFPIESEFIAGVCELIFECSSTRRSHTKTT